MAWQVGFAANKYGGPTWEDVAQWSRWLLFHRKLTPVYETDLMGHMKGSIERVYLEHAKGHLWRVRYPAMTTMPMSEWNAYWALVRDKFRGFFSEEGQAKLAEEAGAAARAQELARGGDEARQAIAARKAADRVLAGLRAATTQPMAREHATLDDIYLAQDVLLSEQFQVRAHACSAKARTRARAACGAALATRMHVACR